MLAIATAGLDVQSPAQAQSKKTVRIAETAPIALFWPGAVARKKGFYAAEGLEVENTFAMNAALSVQQAMGGSYDVVFTTAESVIRAIDKGGDMVIFGESVMKWPYSFMAAKDVKTPQDMKGKKVILATPKQDLTLIWNQWLAENGMKPSDVDQIFDGATPNRYAALVNGAAQVAVVSQPFDFRAISEGYNQLFDTSFLQKQFSFVVIAGRKDWVAKNPEAADGLVRAIAKAIDWWYDPANKEEAIQILMETSKQSRELVEQTYNYYHDKVQPYPRGAKVQTVGLTNLVATLEEIGEIKKRALAEYVRSGALTN